MTHTIILSIIGIFLLVVLIKDIKNLENID